MGEYDISQWRLASTSIHTPSDPKMATGVGTGFSLYISLSGNTHTLLATVYLVRQQRNMHASLLSTCLVFDRPMSNPDPTLVAAVVAAVQQQLQAQQQAPPPPPQTTTPSQVTS